MALLLFLICSCLMPPPEGSESTTGSASTTGLTSIAKVTEAPTNSTTGTKKGLSGESSPSYRRKILDISKFLVSFQYLLHAV